MVLLCACGAAYLLYDWQSVKLAVNEALHAGTLKGVENCVAYSKSDLMSAEATRYVCIDNFQKNLYDGDLATGRAGPDDYSGRVNLSGSLENKTSDFVTTWVQLYLKLYDATGTEKEFQAETYIWIEPHSTADFSVELLNLKPDGVETTMFCDVDDTSPKSCMRWGVAKIKGIEI